MKNNQKGFANFVLIGVIVVLIVLGGYFAWLKNGQESKSDSTDGPIIIKTTPTSTEVTEVVPIKVKPCEDPEITPEIYSLSTTFVSVGDSITIHGCRLYGFEGDKNVWIENSNGVKGILYGVRDTDYENLEFKLTAKVCEEDNSYTGWECKKWLTLTPGVYKLYVIPWSKKSNEVSITIK